MWGGYWWVFAFCAVTAGVYFHSMKEKRSALSCMRLRLEQMEAERSLAVQKGEELRLRIASQNDPAWVEMILMRDLGVVPEGFLKVHFKK